VSAQNEATKHVPECASPSWDLMLSYQRKAYGSVVLSLADLTPARVSLEAAVCACVREERRLNTDIPSKRLSALIKPTHLRSNC